jgi:hypothetical protein
VEGAGRARTTQARPQHLSRSGAGMVQGAGKQGGLHRWGLHAGLIMKPARRFTRVQAGGRTSGRLAVRSCLLNASTHCDE